MLRRGPCVSGRKGLALWFWRSLQGAQARGQHFAKRGGIFAQELLREGFARFCELRGRHAGRAEVGAVERGKLRGLRAGLLRRLPELARWAALLRIVHGLCQPFRR